MFKCKYCGKEFETKQQLAGHIIWCKENPNRSGKSNFHNKKYENDIRPQDVIRDDLFCQYCGKQCKNLNSLRQHEIRCKENPNKIDNTNSCNNIINYNKNIANFDNVTPKRNQFTKAKFLGLEKPIVTEETRLKLSECSKKQIWTDDKRKKLSNSMHLAVQKYPESYSSANVNGRVKKYKYKDIYLDGTWEVKFAKFLDENNIKWERPSKGIEYIYEGKKHLYFPDFYINDYDIYIEIKGLVRDSDYYKWQVVKNLKVLYADDIKLIDKQEFKIEDILK